ncbi:site-specific integrase [Paenibacillus physcomitrellae]|uniref:Core-binding (CB) domain-containing protein n=1 Tax=Paenibacillus physcomitrellae TaxID=1619311 RepID=A0ABQ1GHL7_9BACL|nr:site-specific integrase [Paenibacillus physcomitrellae]GGA43865.1 hypothetical protein GCM10010917_31460 [Paenibacillus physcomitrellae]
MNELSPAFRRWLFEEGRAEKTIESYVGDVVAFQKYLGEKAVDISQPLSRFAFVRYKQHLVDEHFALATTNKKINSLKVYKDFLLQKDWVEEAYTQLKKDQVKIAAGSGLVGIRQDIDFLTSSLLVLGKGGKVREIRSRSELAFYHFKRA